MLHASQFNNKVMLCWSRKIHARALPTLFEEKFLKHTKTENVFSLLYIVFGNIAITQLCQWFEFTPFDGSEHCIDIVILIWAYLFLY
jgi:hypothetical protein